MKSSIREKIIKISRWKHFMSVYILFFIVWIAWLMVTTFLGLSQIFLITTIPIICILDIALNCIICIEELPVEILNQNSLINVVLRKQVVWSRLLFWFIIVPLAVIMRNKISLIVFIICIIPAFVIIEIISSRISKIFNKKIKYKQI